MTELRCIVCHAAAWCLVGGTSYCMTHAGKAPDPMAVREYGKGAVCARIEEAFHSILPPYMMNMDEDTVLPGRTRVTVNEALADVWIHAMNIALEAVDGERR